MVDLCPILTLQVDSLSCAVVTDVMASSSRYCEFSHHKKDYILINHSGGPNGTREIADGFDRVFRYARISKRHRDYIHKEMMSERF